MQAVFLPGGTERRCSGVDFQGCTQLSIRIASPVELEAEGDRIFAEHERWIRRTHHRSGDRALLQYLVAKRPARDGVVVFHLTEIYQSPAGVADHLEQAQQWDTVDAWNAWFDKCQVKITHDAVVQQSLW
jgi:hypothetical protein